MDQTFPTAAGDLPATEQRNPKSLRLEEMTTVEMLELLNDEERVAIEAVATARSELAALVEAAEQRVRAGGRIHYLGAGTSGRLGVLDAAEVVPTFGTDPELIQAHLAGGDQAIANAVEDAEDSEEDGRRVAAAHVRPGDVAIGLTVSGTTPYVRGALTVAKERGALTALVTSNPASPIAPLATHVVVAETGPEVLTGSTRLKAGTATKVLLNGFSTALMVRLGRTYSNLMVAVLATNEKLRHRTLRILGEVAGDDPERNAKLLADAGGDLRVAVVASVAGVSVDEASAALERDSGSVPEALRRLASGA